MRVDRRRIIRRVREGNDRSVHNVMKEQSSEQVSTLEAWLIAIRPHTLPAAISPVLVGAGLGMHHDVFAAGPVVVAGICAMFIQAATNVANDYFDAEKGVDEEREYGFPRVTASGFLAPNTVRNGMMFIYGLAVGSGIYLVYLGGVPILAVGVIGIFCGITYSGGPVPYGSIGLGDLMVFVFFGVVAVTGTYFVQAVPVVFPVGIPSGTIPVDVVLASLPAAALSTAILVVNNLRDFKTDRAAGKTTLAVLVGRTGTRVEFTGLLLLSYAVPVWLAVRPGYTVGWFALLPLFSVPLAAVILYTVWTVDRGAVLNDTLTRTGRLLFLHSLLFAAGFLF